MTYYGAKELAESFRTVRGNTVKAAMDIPESQYGFQAAPETRTVEKLLTHIALGHRFSHQFHVVERRTNFEGMDFPALFAEFHALEAKPRTKTEIIALLKENGEIWGNTLEGLSEEFLSEIVSMPPGATPATKSRFEMLLSVKEHEMHHRSQIMLIERMLGIVPHLTREAQQRMSQMQNRQAEKNA